MAISVSAPVHSEVTGIGLRAVERFERREESTIQFPGVQTAGEFAKVFDRLGELGQRTCSLARASHRY